MISLYRAKLIEKSLYCVFFRLFFLTLVNKTSELLWEKIRGSIHFAVESRAQGDERISIIEIWLIICGLFRSALIDSGHGSTAKGKIPFFFVVFSKFSGFYVFPEVFKKNKKLFDSDISM